MHSRARKALGLCAPVFSFLLIAGCDRKTPVEPETADTSYNLELRYYGATPAANVQAAFELARSRIQAMIAAGLPPSQLNNLNLADANTCGVPVTLNETVDDLVIYVTVKTIDGVGRVAASSGPCVVRSTGKLPVIGRMEMDVDDVNQLANTGRLNAVVLHEMLHVIGFGTIWDQVTPSRVPPANSTDPRFSGPQAIQGCNEAGGTTICSAGVPIEDCVGVAGCGVGTRDSHWRETTFRSELMTGFIEASNIPMPLSAMSIRSLEDLGYSVSVTGAEGYKIPGTAIRFSDESSEVVVPWEVTHRPLWEVSTDGRIVKTRNREN